jgi:alpha-L-fucosidase
VNQVIQLLVGAAGRNSNLLLNVGPMPSGAIQPEFVDTLAAAGSWLRPYAESIYGTRGGPLSPQPWGVTTQKEKKIYIHLFKSPGENGITLPATKEKVKQASLLGTSTAVKFKQQKEGITISTEGITTDGPDTILVVEMK